MESGRLSNEENTSDICWVPEIELENIFHRVVSEVFSRGLICNVKLRYKKKERGVEKVAGHS